MENATSTPGARDPLEDACIARLTGRVLAVHDGHLIVEGDLLAIDESVDA